MLLSSDPSILPDIPNFPRYSSNWAREGDSLSVVVDDLSVTLSTRPMSALLSIQA